MTISSITVSSVIIIIIIIIALSEYLLFIFHQCVI